MKNLDHTQIRQLIQEGLENLDVGERAAVEQHVAACADCQRFSIQQEQLSNNLAHAMRLQWDTARPATNLENTLRARLVRTSPLSRVSPGVRRFGFAVVAVLLLGLGGLFFSQGTPLAGIGFGARTNTTFGGEIQFQGLAPVPFMGTVLGTPMTLHTYWTAQSTPSGDYMVSIQALDVQGTTIVQIDKPLLDKEHPTSQWQPNEPKTVDFGFILPPGEEVAQYQIGVYRSDTGKHLLTSDGKLAFNIDLPPSADLLQPAFAFDWACPTPEPTRLLTTRYYQPTAAPFVSAAPRPTINPNATPRPTRAPRPPRTPKPTPAIIYLDTSAGQKMYKDPAGFSFVVPLDWHVQVSRPETRRMQPGMFFSNDIQVYVANHYPPALPQVSQSLQIDVTLSQSFCDGQTLEKVLAQDQSWKSITPLQPQAPVGGLPAFRRQVESTFAQPSYQGIQVLVPHGNWLYRFLATPANSNQMAAFEHLLATFKTP